MTPRLSTLPEIGRAAKQALSREVWGYGAGGAETETTLRRNRRAIRRLAIRQRVLRDVRSVDLTASFLGLELPSPIAIAPMGGLVLFHPRGDCEMVRGAAPSRTLAVVSGVTGWAVEEVAQESAGPLLFQLYHGGPRSWVEELLGRVVATGRYCGVCVTVDLPVYGRRERDLQLCFDPQGARRIAPNPPPPDMAYQARLTWDDLGWLCSAVSLPVGVKGILSPEDARLALDVGARIVWVSNHGGRQLDHTLATIDVLPAIVDAVAGKAEIVVDGGFGRGTDVIKAVALGADVVAMGRTFLWGLAAAGAPGVDRTVALLRDEMQTSLALCGQTSMRSLTPELIQRVDY